MVETISHVPKLLLERKMTKAEFALAMQNAGVSQDTAYRLVKGEGNFTIDTLKIAAKVLGVDSISDIMDIAGNGSR